MWALSAEAAWLLGDLEAMSVRIERSLALGVLRPGGPPADVLDTFASLALFEGRLDDARRLLADTLAAVTPGDTSRRLTIIGEQVLAHAYAGEIDAAREVAAGLLAEVGDTVSPFEAFAWYCAGEAELGRDDDRARSLLGRAIDVAERTDTSFVVGIAGASLASLEARHGDVAVAVAAYRRLLDHWYHAGVWATQWPMLRSVAALLHRMGRDRDAAVLVAAVRHTSAGHRLYGADAVAMAELDDDLRRRLGPSEHTAARAEGLVLDGDAAVEHALRSLA